MAKLLKLRRGTTSQHGSFTGAEGEVTVDTDKESLVVHNGSTAGGFPIARADGTGVSNFTITGELDAATLDISGNADIDGTLEADAYTVDGTALNEYIADTVGAMVGSNTETGIAVTYEDSDNTLDFVLGAAQSTVTSLGTLTGLTVAGDVTFDNGTNAGKDITWDESDDSLEFADNTKAVFGDGGDLKIFHNGTDNWIEGHNGNVGIAVNSGNEVAAKFISDGAVELYNNNFKSFQTDSHGIAVYGPEGASANVYIYADEGDDNADKWRVQSSVSGGLFIDNYTSGSWETNIECAGNGAVKLRYDNSTKLETTSSGITISGGISQTGYIDIDSDTSKLRLGDSQDLQIYHDGTNSYMDSSTNDLYIRSTGDDVHIQAADDLFLYTQTNENAIICNGNGSVDLYHDAVKTCETHSNGIIVQGPEGGSAQIAMYADEGDDNADKWLINAADGSDLTIQSYSTGSWQNELTLTNAGNLTALGNVTAYSDARLKTDIETLDNALDKVTKLRGVSYKRLDTQEAGIGVIAQEIENVLPEVVQDGAYKSVAYGNVVGLLIEAIKELKAELDEHKKTNCGGN